MNLSNGLFKLSASRKRIVLFALLYASEGAPIGFMWWTLPTELRTLGIPINDITALTSLLVLPWTLKFLWAPLVDIIRSSRWTLRSWIIAAQLTMSLSLLPMVFLDISAHYSLAVLFFMLHTFAAATQDVAIDALCISEVPASERGTVNGWMQAGMLAGRALFGGGAIAVTQYVEMKTIIGVLLLFILGTTAVVLLTQPAPSHTRTSFTEKRRDFFNHFRLMIPSRRMWLGLLFAVTGGTAYESIGAVSGPMFVDHGFSKENIGLFFSVFSISAMFIGAIAGGYAVRRFGVFPLVNISLLFVVAVAFSISALLTSSLFVSHTALTTVMTLLYFGIGLFTASTYTMFMNITDPNLGATQFSTFMGGTNLCESLSAYTAGVLVLSSGYAVTFTVMAIISLLSLAILHLLQKKTAPPI